MAVQELVDIFNSGVGDANALFERLMRDGDHDTKFATLQFVVQRFVNEEGEHIEYRRFLREVLNHYVNVLKRGIASKAAHSVNPLQKNEILRQLTPFWKRLFNRTKHIPEDERGEDGLFCKVAWGLLQEIPGP